MLSYSIYLTGAECTETETQIAQLLRNVLTYTTKHKEQLKTQALLTHGLCLV